MNRSIILMFLCLSILAFGCRTQENSKGNFTQPSGSQAQMPAELVAATPPVDQRLIGTWTEGSLGGGRLSYTFRADGTYQRLVLSVGFINGLGSEDGRYTLVGDLLVMHAIRESWKPMGEGQQPGFTDRPTDQIERKHVRLPDSQTLILADEQFGYEDQLGRVPER
jgi:hypothetical protein